LTPLTTIYIKCLFLVWVWLEFSFWLLRGKNKVVTFLAKHRDTLECAALYGILLLFIENREVENYLHILFIPFLLSDLIFRNEKTKTYIFFWLEVLVILALVYSGLNITFVTNPEGGLLYFNRSIVFVSFFWMIFIVSLLNLCNFMDGLLFGICAVLAHTFLFGILIQPTVAPGATHFAIVLCSFCTLLWLFVLLKQKNGLSSPLLSSVLSLLIAILSIIATTKKIALIAISVPLGLMTIPIIFFAFLIFMTHFRYKRKTENLADKSQHLWRFSTVSVNSFVMLCTITLNFIIAVALLMEDKIWAAGLICFAFVMFCRLAHKIFIKHHVLYKDLFFPNQDHVEMFGIRVFRHKKDRAVELVDKILQKPQQRVHHLVTPDALCLFRTTQEPEFASILQQAFMAIPDGSGILWASTFLKERPIMERIPGVDFMKDLLALSEKKSYRVFFLGAKADILELAVKKLQNEFPNLQISGTENGYYDRKKEIELVEKINKSNTDILFLALGVPLQEQWIDKYRNRLKVKLVMGIGGSLDVISGKLRRSPQFFQDYGLEWLYRTLREPWRISRIYALPLYIVMVLKEKLRLGDMEQEEEFKGIHTDITYTVPRNNEIKDELISKF
jgi:N-acetylglucosaminyldiphosphoundecaprenol N-acetyl-beta-D-mannosaminyltransferase